MKELKTFWGKNEILFTSIFTFSNNSFPQASSYALCGNELKKKKNLAICNIEIGNEIH